MTAQRPVFHVLRPKHGHTQLIHIVLIAPSALRKVLIQCLGTFCPAPAFSRPSYYTSPPHNPLSKVTPSDANFIVSYSASQDVYHSSQNHKHKHIVTRDNYSFLDAPTNRLWAGIKNLLVAYYPRKLPYLPPTIPNWQGTKRHLESAQLHWSLT